MYWIIQAVGESHLFQMFATSLGINWLGWAVSALLHTEKFYDLTGSLTFILISHLSHNKSVMNTYVLMRYFIPVNIIIKETEFPRVDHFCLGLQAWDFSLHEDPQGWLR